MDPEAGRPDPAEAANGFGGPVMGSLGLFFSFFIRLGK